MIVISAKGNKPTYMGPEYQNVNTSFGSRYLEADRRDAETKYQIEGLGKS